MFVVEAGSMANGLQLADKESWLEMDSVVSESPLGTNKEEKTVVSKFSMNTLFEYTALAEVYLGKRGKVGLSLALIFYSFGVIISKIIMSGNILSELFQQTDVLKCHEFYQINFLIYNNINGR